MINILRKLKTRIWPNIPPGGMSEDLEDIVDTAFTLHSDFTRSHKFPSTNPPAVVEKRDEDIMGPKE